MSFIFSRRLAEPSVKLPLFRLFTLDKFGAGGKDCAILTKSKNKHVKACVCAMVIYRTNEGFIVSRHE